MHSIDFAAEFDRLEREGQRESTMRQGAMAIRLVRVAGGGEGRWDSHAGTAETVVVWRGDFTVEFREAALRLGPGQCCVVPARAEHRGTSQTGADVILITQQEG